MLPAYTLPPAPGRATPSYTVVGFPRFIIIMTAFLLCTRKRGKQFGAMKCIESLLECCVGVVFIAHVLLTFMSSTMPLLCGLAGLGIQVLYFLCLQMCPPAQLKYKLFCIGCGEFSVSRPTF